MKNKNVIIICAIMLIFTLTSCNKYKLQETQTQTQYNSIFPDYEYNQEEVQAKYGYSNIAIAENGYYYIIDNILYFYNINSDVNMPLCSKVNCVHSDDNCDAYVNTIDTRTTDTRPGSFACNCMGNRVFYYNNCLYCIEVTEDRDYDLYQYDAAFGNKKKLLKLASVKDEQMMVTTAQACIISEGYLYYYTSYLDPQYAQNGYIAEFQCNRIKLEENAVREVLGEFEFPGDYAMMAGDSNGLAIYLSDGNIYFYAGGTARMYTADNKVQYRVSKYNPLTGQYNMIWTYTGDDKSNVLGENTGNVNYKTGGKFVKMDSKGNFYILTSTNEDSLNNNMIVKVNFEDNIRDVIYTTQMENLYSLESDGENLYFFESTMSKNTKSYFNAISTDGTLKSKHEMLFADEYLAYMEAYYKQFPDDNSVMPDASNIIIYGMDQRYILMGSEANVFKGLRSENKDKVLVDEILISGVGVINTKDYLNNENISIKQIYQYEP